MCLNKKITVSRSALNKSSTPTSKTPTKNAAGCGMTDTTVTKTSSRTSPSTTKRTRVVIKYNVGFANALYLRGRGANLSWNKGIKLQNVSSDEWVWETNTPFSNCEFKVLINDSVYEAGENHNINCGSDIKYTPHFNT